LTCFDLSQFPPPLSLQRCADVYYSGFQVVVDILEVPRFQRLRTPLLDFFFLVYWRVAMFHIWSGLKKFVGRRCPFFPPFWILPPPVAPASTADQCSSVSGLLRVGAGLFPCSERSSLPFRSKGSFLVFTRSCPIDRFGPIVRETRFFPHWRGGCPFLYGQGASTFEV